MSNKKNNENKIINLSNVRRALCELADYFGDKGYGIRESKFLIEEFLRIIKAKEELEERKKLPIFDNVSSVRSFKIDDTDEKKLDLIKKLLKELEGFSE